MKIEEILKNNENKIIFLKAVLLGIKYGESDKSEIYKKNIENDIFSLSNEIENKDSNSKNNNNKELNNKEIKNDKEIINNKMTESEKINFVIKNLTKNIIDLENVRNNIISNVTNLSYNINNNNYSKINSLRNNLNKINLEIENKRLNLLKFIEDKNLKNLNFKSKNIKRNNNKNINPKKDYVTLAN